MGTRSAAAPATSIRVASALFLVGGAGIAVTTPIAIAHLARHGDLPLTPFGFRLLAGPVEALGREAVAICGLALTVVSVLDVVAGVRLWQGRRSGARLGIATSPAAFLLGVAFAVPFLLVVAPLRVALILAGRASLR